ncbi:hypothetical protein BJ742DRAFT_106505 [Cladochytrium replicatum]|nr:hypothetical protein BJ742DRAFT_106505 [Cladochytrium replicatum]
MSSPSPLSKSDSTLLSHSATTNSVATDERNRPNGVVILKDDSFTPYPPVLSLGPLPNQYGYSSDVQDSGMFQPFPQFPQPSFSLPPKQLERTWWQRYKWFIIVFIGLLVLAGVVTPAVLLAMNKGSGAAGSTPSTAEDSARTTTGSQSATTGVTNTQTTGGPSIAITTTNPTSSLASSPTSNPASSPSPSPAPRYPIVLSSGSVLFDPIVHPSNSPQATYNLSSIQRFVSVVDNSNAKWRYHVAFGRTLSTAEAALSNPITKSRCNTNTAVCQEQIGGPDAYNVAVVSTLGFTTVSNNGTPGLLIAFERTPGDPGFCLWRVTITILCSATTTSAPKFVSVAEADDASTCHMDFTYLHSNGCAV